jgi:hypothetical protein
MRFCPKQHNKIRPNINATTARELKMADRDKRTVQALILLRGSDCPCQCKAQYNVLDFLHFISAKHCTTGATHICVLLLPFANLFCGTEPLACPCHVKRAEHWRSVGALCSFVLRVTRVSVWCQGRPWVAHALISPLPGIHPALATCA